jgi:hypothetical protein
MKTENTTQTQAENYRKREKKRKLKFLLLPNPPLVVGVDNLGSCILARSRAGHPLQRIDLAILGEGAQAHRQYLHCPHQVEPRWIGWLRRFACSSQHTLQLWPCFVVVGDIVRRAPRRLRWAPHNLVGAPMHPPHACICGPP